MSWPKDSFVNIYTRLQDKLQNLTLIDSKNTQCRRFNAFLREKRSGTLSSTLGQTNNLKAIHNLCLAVLS